MRTFLVFAFILSFVKFSNGQTLSWVGQIDRIRPNSVYADGSGNVYTTGMFRGTIDFDPGPSETLLSAPGGSDAIYVQKLDASGNMVWARHIVGGINGEGFSVATDDAANVYAIGYFRGTMDFDPGPGTFNMSSTAPSFNDFFILKLDVNGNLVWARQLKNVYETTPTASLAVDGDGNVYCTGLFKGVVDFDPGDGEQLFFSGADYAGFILKLNTSGNIDWVNPFSALSYGHAIATDGEHVYVTGYFMGTVGLAPPAVNLTSKGMADTFLLKLTAAGEYVWVKQIGGPGNDYGSSISLDNNGNVYFTGEFQQTCDFNIDGPSVMLNSAGMGDIFLQKFGAAGNVLWVKKIGGAGSDTPRNISITSTGALFVAGQFSGTASFEIGATPKTFSSTSGGLFILNVTPSEEIGWLTQYQANDLWMAAGGDHVYATGEFFNTIDFDPGEATKSMTASTGGSAFILKLENEILEEEEEEDEEEESITGVEELTQARFSVYPNPVKSVAFIDLEENSHNEFTLRIKDVHNRIVKEQVIQNTAENQIDMTGLTDGLYIIELTRSGTKIKTAKVMKD